MATLLLATDTSGKHGSIALARCALETCDVIEVVPLVGGTFSAQLVPQISALLAKHRLSKGDLGGFAVASGPGSFTGLRVGLAAIKALAEVLQKPIAVVSLLEAVAVSGGLPGKVMAVLDAGRGEVYVGECEVSGDSMHMVSERLLTRDEFQRAAHGRTVVTPDDCALEAAGLSVKAIEHPRSDVVARLGWRKIQAGETVSPEHLEANYIRRSDAEIFAKSSGS
jgi:tRNA threonylcarbamoyladenosine biosynthesis protein TsaB